MMRVLSLKRFCLLSIFSFLVSSLFVASASFSKSADAAFNPADVKRMLGRLAKDFPESEAVVIKDSLVVTMRKDGRINRRVHRLVALFTDDAVHRYGDPRILFDSSRQRLSVERARVYMSEGKVVDTQKNGINQTTPFALAAAADYTSWQETVVTHVGIEKPCIVELCYTIDDTEPFFPACSGVEVFNEGDPVLEKVVRVTVPPRTKLAHAEINGAPSPSVSNGGRTYTWLMKSLEAGRSVQGSADYIDYLPSVVFSTESDWSDPAGRIAGWFGEAIRNCDFSGALLEGVVKETDDDAAYAVQIQRRVAGAVKAIRAPFPQFELKPRDAERIYNTSYGDSFDRAVLLGALLKEEGYQPYPVLVSKGHVDVKGLPPALELFDRILIAVPVDGNPLLLDPTTPYDRAPEFSLPGALFLYCSTEPAIKVNRAWETDSNLDLLTLNVSFDREDLVCKGEAELKGVFSPYWIVRGTDDELRQYLERQSGSIFKGAQVVSCNIEKLDRDDVKIGFKVVVNGFLSKSERVYMDLPKPIDQSAGELDGIDITGSRAYAPFRVIPQRCRMEVRIEKPAGWKFAALPKNDSQSYDIGSLNIVSKKEASGGFSVNKELMLKADIVPVKSYRMLRSLLVAYEVGTIVLEKE